MSADLPARSRSTTDSIPSSFFATLITANHILYSQRVVDGFGHVSARSPRDPSTFFISGKRAPALVSKREHLVEYRVGDASPVERDAPSGYLERFIHSEIYKRYPDVQAVVHGHTDETVVFGVTGVPLRPVYHMAGAMGHEVPVFDIARVYQPEDEQTMLVTNERLGQALAEMLAPKSHFSKTGQALKSLFHGGKHHGENLPAPEEQMQRYPSFPVVLMRGHGFTAVGTSVEEAVFRSVYTVQNARIQISAITLKGANYEQREIGAADRLGREGYAGTGSLAFRGIEYLSEKEAMGGARVMLGQVQRSWELWAMEARANGLLKSEFWDE